MRRLCLALGLVSALACGSDSTGPGDVVMGTWDLMTVNGAAVPFTLAEEPDFKFEILADQIVAYGDSTWSGTTTFRATEAGTATTTIITPSGIWSQSGSRVTLRYPDGSVARATISGDVITFSGNQLVAVYERQ